MSRSSCNSIKHLTSLPSTQLFSSQKEIKRISPPVFNKTYTNTLSKEGISTKKFSETDIINMREFLIDNIFVMFGGCVFQQTVGIPIGTNCAPFLADLFLYLHKVDFIQELLTKNEKKLARSFNFTFRCTCHVI